MNVFDNNNKKEADEENIRAKKRWKKMRNGGRYIRRNFVIYTDH
jgi:hypothetical protein